MEKSGLAWTDKSPFCPGQTLGESLLTPTRLYVRPVLPLVRAGLVKALAHITGGGLLDNLPRVLPEGLVAEVDVSSSGWTLPPVFAWLQTIARLPQTELLRTFNCGVGMVLVVEEKAVDDVMRRLEGLGETDILRLGRLRARADGEASLAPVQLAGLLC